AYHADHFHVDLARHGEKGTYKYCKPRLNTPAPARPPYDGTLYAAIPGQPRYELMMSAYAEGGPSPLARMPEQVLLSPVAPDYGASPFFTKAREGDILEAGDDVLDR